MLRYKSYTFICSNKNFLDNIIIKKNIFNNDIYQKFEATLNIEGQLIVCRDSTKITTSTGNIIEESYDDYLKFLESYDMLRDQWIYNIIDGLAEQDKILYQDEEIIIIPNYTWNEKKIEDLHILTIPKDKSLRSIRSLTGKNINLLKKIKEKTCEIIKLKYNLDSNVLKMFCHYSPSTYHLHVHFAKITNKNINSSVECSHDLTNIISNLEINPDYYKLVIINKREVK